jgi:hypothetical protein
MVKRIMFRQLELFRPIKPHRIIDQQFVLQLRCHRDMRDEVDQQAVVGHVIPEIGMRPVGAPQHAIGKALDDAPDGI